MSGATIKPVSWIGSSYKDFREFPDPVQDAMGYALYQAQIGLKHGSARPLKGFGGAGVLELVADHLIRRRLKAAEADFKAQLEKGKAS
jgi:phage-related protein